MSRISVISPAHVLMHCRYTIAWKRNLPEIDLDGVEFKCLPSGLHSVKEDLVYFVHGTYAGVSAFIQEEADEQHRNAYLVAIGALVPLTYGRLGKSWRHAAELRLLAKERVKDSHDCRALELFWWNNRQDETAAKDEPASPSMLRSKSPPDAGSRRKRARSDASANLSSSGDYLTPDHPALSMTDLLKTFGPLVFPIHRAALLRKRILLLGSPPVQQTCNFVYNISILSSIPQPLSDIIQSNTEDLSRIQTLFSVGVHDIPFLKDKKRQSRWLACTTDDILSEKKALYDIIVKFPSQQSSIKPGQWPQIRTADGKDLKATQRDLRRYRLLRSELQRTTESRTRYQDDPGGTDNDDNSTITPLMRAPTTTLLNEVKHADPGDHLVCESVSWTAVAYNGFMWWASAGEMQAWENEEARTDRQLLDEIPEASDLLRHINPSSSVSTSSEEDIMRREMAEATVLTAYFHRLTSGMLQPLADLVEDADDETVEGVAEEGILVSSDDVREMGLDVWSAGDREFVREAAELYFGRKAKVDEYGGGVRICGVRVC